MTTKDYKILAEAFAHAIVAAPGPAQRIAVEDALKGSILPALDQDNDRFDQVRFFAALRDHQFELARV